MDNSGADKCPLCGNDNSCVMAAGKPAETCWCAAVEIAPEALAALTDSERGVRCICASCAGGERTKT